MFQMSSQRIASAALAAALSISVFAQASLAAELDAASVPSTSSIAPSVQQQTVAIPQLGQTFTAPYVVSRTSDGWELDDGGPALRFEYSGE